MDVFWTNNEQNLRFSVLDKTSQTVAELKFPETHRFVTTARHQQAVVVRDVHAGDWRGHPIEAVNSLKGDKGSVRGVRKRVC